LLLQGTLGGAVAAALAACGGSSSGGSGANPAEPVVKPTIEPKADGDLTWFTWSEYVAPGIVSGFEKKYGVKVNQTFFDSDDAMLQKLAAGLPYDVVTTNSAYLYRAAAGKLIQSFDLTSLPHHGELVSYFQAPAYDKAKYRYSVPYSGGPTGILYRKDKVHVAGSWTDLWNNAAAKGHIFVLDQVEETIGMSLLRNGDSLNSADPGQVGKATDQLLKLKSQLGGISDDINNDIGNGNSWISHSWSTNAYQMMTGSKYKSQLGFELPKEGAPFGMDTLSIGANAKSPGTALLFLDWMLQPENSVANVRYTGQLAGTTAGDAEYSKAVKDLPDLHIPANFYATAKWKQSLYGSRETLWSEQWNRFKA
jgi:spermidine/putrescine transport system substrate-binding protein